MPVRKKDFTEQTLRDCREIKKVVKALQGLAAHFGFGKDRAQIDRQLVRLHILVSRVYALASPPLSSGELHGLPEGMTEGQFTPKPAVVRKSKPNWDFMPWFLEKTSELRRWTDEAFNMFETERAEAARWMSNYILSEAEKPKEERSLPDSPEVIVRSRLHLHLAAILQADESLLELLRSGDLKIAEVRPREEEP